MNDGLEDMGQALDLLPEVLHVCRLVSDEVPQVERQHRVQDGEHVVRPQAARVVGGDHRADPHHLLHTDVVWLPRVAEILAEIRFIFVVTGIFYFTE